jgi:hypothetical protein
MQTVEGKLNGDFEGEPIFIITGINKRFLAISAVPS